jgi:hypothetical protein
LTEGTSQFARSSVAIVSQLGITDAAKLVYRDHIKMKHSSRKRLKTEVEGKMQLPPRAKLARSASQPCIENQQHSASGDEAAKGTNILSKLLMAYVLEARVFMWSERQSMSR